MSYTTDPKAQERLRQREKFAERQRRDDLKAVMSTLEGRRFIWHLAVARVLVVSTSFDSSMFFHEGQRSVGVQLLADLQEICPPLYVTMFQEAINAQQEDELHFKSARDAANREEE